MAQFSRYFDKMLLFLLLLSRLHFAVTRTLRFTEYGFWRWFMMHKRREEKYANDEMT